MKVLVTGGGGFLGRYVVDLLLARGDQVVALQRSQHPDLEARGVRVIAGALTDAQALRAALEGCDAVIHTAAKAGVAGPRQEFFAANLEGSLLLRDEMELAGVRQLVHCSTPSVVFNGESFEGADERLPYGRNWLCHYAESKALAEAALLDWGRSGKGRVIALRPHLLWGVGDPHLLPKVIDRSARGRLRIIGDGTNRVDVTRVENAAAAHVLALDALGRDSAVNRAYFVSQGQPVQLWPWINDLLARVHVAPLQRRIGARSAYRIGAVAELLWALLRRDDVPPMTRFVAVELSKSHWFSIAAARAELGYAPELFPAAEGIRNYAEAWLAGRTPR